MYVKTPLTGHSAIGNEHLSSLSLVYRRRDIDINILEVIDEFNKCHLYVPKLAFVAQGSNVCMYMYTFVHIKCVGHTQEFKLVLYRLWECYSCTCT